MDEKKIIEKLGLNCIITTLPDQTREIRIFRYENGLIPIYSFEGNFKVVSLDDETILIVEAQKSAYHLNEKDPNHRAITFIGSNKTDTYKDTFEVPAGSSITIDENIAKIKKVILPFGYKFAVYSYEFGIVTSAQYHYIRYSQDTNTFFVRYLVTGDKGESVLLHGTLDSEGHLINDELYSPLLNKNFPVDEHNLEESIQKIKNKLCRMIEQKRNRQALYDYEYELERKRRAKK